jgi:hypothetical protein
MKPESVGAPMVFEKPRGMHANGIRKLIVEVSSNSSQCDPRVGIEDVKGAASEQGASGAQPLV